MNKRATMFLATGAFALLATAGAALTANAFSGSAADDETRTKMETAMENRDYAAWRDIIESQPKITDIITEENFDRFAEMHELMQDGKATEARAIAEELGLPEMHGKLHKGMHGSGRGHGKMMFSAPDPTPNN